MHLGLGPEDLSDGRADDQRLHGAVEVQAPVEPEEVVRQHRQPHAIVRPGVDGHVDGAGEGGCVGRGLHQHLGAVELVGWRRWDRGQEGGGRSGGGEAVEAVGAAVERRWNGRWKGVQKAAKGGRRAVKGGERAAVKGQHLAEVVRAVHRRGLHRGMRECGCPCSTHGLSADMMAQTILDRGMQVG